VGAAERSNPSERDSNPTHKTDPTALGEQKRRDGRDPEGG
jgi:hypothetical protein